MEEIKPGQVWVSRSGAHWFIDQIMADGWGLTPVRCVNDIGIKAADFGAMIPTTPKTW